jgi:gluconokinase
MKMLKERTYSEKEKEGVYDEMFKAAEKLLKEKKKAILDATFYKKALLEKAKTIASGTGSGFFVVECLASDEVILKRITERKNAKTKSESEADFEIYKKVKRSFEQITEKHCVVDTLLPLEKQVEQVKKYIGE